MIARGQAHDPAARQHRDRGRRPALRAHPAGNARRDRRRLQPLAQARLASHDVLCCPDKFRGSLTAREAAAAMCRGVRARGLRGAAAAARRRRRGNARRDPRLARGHAALDAGDRAGRRRRRGGMGGARRRHGDRRDGTRERPRARRAQRPAGGDDVRHRRADRRRDRPRLPPGDRRRRRLGDDRRRARSARCARLDAARRRRSRSPAT